MPIEQVVACERWASQKKLKPNFEWSLKPMTTLLCCLGIPLHLQSSQQYFRFFSQRTCWWMVTSLGLFLFFLHLECHLISRAFPMSLSQMNEINASTTIYEKLTSSSALAWNNFIDHTNTMTLVLGSHITMLTCLLTNWCQVAKVLNRIEELLFYTDHDYKRFRNTSIGGLIASLFAVVNLIVHIIIYCLSASTPIMMKVIHIARHLFPICLFASVFLFCSLGGMISVMLNILGERIAYHRNQERKPAGYWRRQLKTWKSQYYLICELVYHVNSCFGPLLLIVLACYFVKMINNSFTLLTMIRTISIFQSTNMIHLYTIGYYILQDFLLVLIVAYIPYLIHQTAVGLVKKLQSLHMEDFALQDQVSFLKIEMSLSLPRMTAAGFFEVNCQLIPTLIGTTLTYLIILYQFDVMEK